MNSRESTQTKLPVLAIGGVLVALLLIGGVYLSRHKALAQLPDVPLQGVDPQVAKAIESAQENVRHYNTATDWGTLGMTLYAHGFGKQALSCFAQAEHLDSREPRWPYYSGLCNFLQNSGSDAGLEDLKQAATLANGVPDAPGLFLAETLLDRGKTQDAQPWIQQALDRDPNNSRALLDQGRLSFKENKVAQAKDALVKSYQNTPNIKATQLLLSQLFLRQGDAKGADMLAKQAARLPDQPNWRDPFIDQLNQLQVGQTAQIQRGEVLVVSGQFGQAITLMSKTTRDYPKSGRAWMLLGASYDGVGNPTEGEKALRKAAALDPKSAETLNHLGDSLAKQNKTKEAIPWFKKAIGLSPNSAEYHFNMGVCLLRLKDAAAATKEFRTSLRLEPTSVKAHAGLAEALARQGQKPAAIAQLQAALKLNPNDPIIRNSLQQLTGGKLGAR